jgi:hypothetical protein
LLGIFGCLFGIFGVFVGDIWVFLLGIFELFFVGDIWVFCCGYLGFFVGDIWVMFYKDWDPMTCPHTLCTKVI